LGAVSEAAVTVTIKNSFPKKQRLLHHADFERVYKKGRRHFTAHMTVFYLARSTENPDGSVGSRVGFTVSKALGGAVQRNRMRRRLREAVRLEGANPGLDADIVINPKRTLLTVGFSELRNEVAKTFVVIGKTLQKEKR
jgi:ribonuclease P protein component